MTPLQKAILFTLISVAPAYVSAQQYVNGWTESTFRSGVNGCVASAVPIQMQFMSSNGQTKAGATRAEVEAARTMATKFEISVCTCAIQEFMQAVKFDEVQSIKRRPDYAHQVMATCANKVLKNRK